MNLRPDRIALNPLQWMASPDGWLDRSMAPPLPERLTAIRAAGILSVYAEVPPGLETREYGRLLADHGLSAAPGYITVALPDDAETDRQVRERAERISAYHAELGVPTVFMAMNVSRDGVRAAHPAVGYDADAGRLEQVRDRLAEIAAIVRAAGVAPALHPHVGTWVETEEETRFVLDTVDAGLLAFGPDTGHLGWAGADPARLIRDYADRVASVHIKDYDIEVARRGRQEGWDYPTTVLAGLWAEPGQASADIDAAIDALPGTFDGWLVIEVDRGAQPTPEESVRLCGQWAQNRF